ncbi:hypothetical protein V9K67_17590 [Paraflavisolibacter sp. H34]|uniref:hypothetical protein n=1 Tax=Huijunlia imazamoxiresistens TaxID=3127457 RepID=UPI003017E3BD
MATGKAHLEEVLEFIREHRSNESNFEKIYAKLEQECRTPPDDEVTQAYVNNLSDIREKHTEEYQKSREVKGNAWPEFENFVAEFEKAITGAMKERA